MESQCVRRKSIRRRWQWVSRRMCHTTTAHPSVGWHADQLTYLGPYTTIASLSLGTRRGFRLRQTDAVDVPASRSKPTRTYEIELGHNSLVTMNAGCQERFKHT